MPTTQTADRPQTTDTSHGEPWRPQQMIEENPIGLSQEAAETLIPKLDEIQCTLWTLYHQYQKHHWLVEGPQFHDLHAFFEEHYQEVHKYLDRVAERITALGGTPTSSPAKQAELSHVDHEPEGTYRLRAMLEHDLVAERTLAEVVRETIDVALQHGDHGTKRTLEKVLTKVENRAHHLDHLLGEDSLELGLTADRTLEA
ncbi:MAG: DNA starvation/stationary phase protection protein [Bacteroidetes bacterium SW_9_63_38]|nr:MAG: DNA starvation/stationary phase protection protein [Bacteroidetes bacterium SW_9_63_38]